MQAVFTQNDFYIELNAFDSDSDVEIKNKFDSNKFKALYDLGWTERPLDSDCSYIFLWQISDVFLKALSSSSEIEFLRENLEMDLSAENYLYLAECVPFSVGSEFVDSEWIENIVRKLLKVFKSEIAEYDGTVEKYFSEKTQSLHTPERIFFHLVENKAKTEQEQIDFPFAFIATYAVQNPDKTVTHKPLKFALSEYKENQDKLLALLACLNKAADVSKFIDEIVESGEIFHTLKLTPQETYSFLKAIPEIEATGILCRIPIWWKKKTASIRLNIKLGEKSQKFIGFQTVLSVKPEFVLDGEVITVEEVESLLEMSEGLALLKGKWVEVNKDKLAALLAEFQRILESDQKISLLDALHGNLFDKKDKDKKDDSEERKEVNVDGDIIITNGDWLKTFLSNMRAAATNENIEVPENVNATLRPYQKAGYSWLAGMYKYGFGACLADDMGLGKTLQTLTFMESIRSGKGGSKKKILLIVPASLIGNWQAESKKFTPLITIKVLHGKPAAKLQAEAVSDLQFLNITTYGMATKIPALQMVNWDCIILDEAQAIKNPASKQTQIIKKIPAEKKIAMTGTPIENNLTNLWSIFDFANKGLLGSSSEFKKFQTELNENPEKNTKLRAMIAPFFLRRLKTDKRIISDLPEKIETTDYITLNKKQKALYTKAVDDFTKRLEKIGDEEDRDPVKRNGLMFEVLIRLKQICNHPDQYLGQEEFAPSGSGKFEMIQEICETIYEKRERVLVFTQFKEMIGPLEKFLEGIFHAKGLTIDGSTKATTRTEYVQKFNGDEYIPFMVLSLKAAGVGLNLVKANHVIHFDRWWNPAIEAQATDRAFRIGQKKNVFVHKFVCKDTIEEKINDMLISKTRLAKSIIGGIGDTGENLLTKMSDHELIEALRME